MKNVMYAFDLGELSVGSIIVNVPTEGPTRIAFITHIGAKTDSCVSVDMDVMTITEPVNEQSINRFEIESTTDDIYDNKQYASSGIKLTHWRPARGSALNVREAFFIKQRFLAQYPNGIE